LRDALLTEALKIIERRGIADISLRELARRLGVSSAAPYHHFATRTELLLALAQNGFERFESVMREELARVDDSPIEQLRALGRAYLKFAAHHPALFRLMFASGFDPVFHLGESVGAKTFNMLKDVVAACLEQSGRHEQDPLPACLAMWGGVHGIAALRLDGELVAMGTTEQIDAICENALIALSLALSPGEPRACQG
jgi:AcrR family transcriptional regulator